MGDAIISRQTDISQKADLNHKHCVEDITSGSLPLHLGGTGATTANDARINLNVYSKSEVDQKINSTSKNLAIYVDVLGNNDTGNGSQENPYATISKAFSVIPKNVNHEVTIHIGEGTFEMPSDVLRGFNGSGEVAIIGQDTDSETKTIISNKLRCRYNTIRKIWIGNITFKYSNDDPNSDDIVDTMGIIEFNRLSFLGTSSQILQAPLKIYNVPNAIIESCRFDYADDAITLIGITRGFINNCTVNNSDNAVALSSGASAILRSQIHGNITSIYRQPNSGSSIIYPNGTFNES